MRERKRRERRVPSWLSTSYNPQPHARHGAQIPVEMLYRIR